MHLQRLLPRERAEKPHGSKGLAILGRRSRATDSMEGFPQKKEHTGLGMPAHDYDPSTQEAEAEGLEEYTAPDWHHGEVESCSWR
jgi:hypothetical protein